jgi:thioredoxin reductase (NADPH)
VENYPGYPEGIQGPEMMEMFHKQAERFGTQFKTGNVDKVDLSKRPFLLHLESGEEMAAEALIISTGASAKWLGLESEARLRNRGVSACATCDGFFFRGKPLAVAGGGDTAMEEALYLTNFATKVVVVHRRDTLRASKVMQDRALKNPKISFEWNSEIEEVLGDDKAGVTGLRLKNSKTGQVKNLEVAGLFVAIGHQPNTGLFKGRLDMDELGYLKVQPGSTYTNVPGVFAAGDAADHVYRQAVTAAGTGCMAAIDAERWLAAQE